MSVLIILEILAVIYCDINRESEFDIQRTVHRIYSYNESQQDATFLNFIVVNNSTCSGQTYCPSSGVLILYSQNLVFVILVLLTVC